jgi:hypothetical protein
MYIFRSDGCLRNRMSGTFGTRNGSLIDEEKQKIPSEIPCLREFGGLREDPLADARVKGL